MACRQRFIPKTPPNPEPFHLITATFPSCKDQPSGWGRLSRLATFITFLIGSFCFSQSDSPQKILFLGDSLTAGFGLSKTEAFPQKIQEKLDAGGYDYQVVNAGISGDTSAGGLRRIDWLLRQKPAILFLALGANDGLRGVQPDETAKNLSSIIDRARKKYPEVQILLAGMKVPPNLGGDYARAFEAVFDKVSVQKQVALMPFLLQDVAGQAKLNLADGIHPTEEGHRIIAENVWTYLEPLLVKP